MTITTRRRCGARPYDAWRPVLTGVILAAASVAAVLSAAPAAQAQTKTNLVQCTLRSDPPVYFIGRIMAQGNLTCAGGGGNDMVVGEVRTCIEVTPLTAPTTLDVDGCASTWPNNAVGPNGVTFSATVYTWCRPVVARSVSIARVTHNGTREQVLDASSQLTPVPCYPV